MIPAFLLIALLPKGGFAQGSPWETPLLGVGVQVRPAFDGSSSPRLLVIPMVRYASDPLFVRTTQGVLEGGVRFRDPRGWSFGLLAAYEEGRPATEFTRERRIEPVDAGVSVGCAAELSGNAGPAPVNLLVRLRRHTVASRGTQVDARITGGVFGGERFRTALYLETTWADGGSARSLYGVTPEQSAESGLEAHRIGAGLLHVTAGLLWSFELSGSWCLLGSAGERWLLGDADRSPLAEQPSGFRMTLGAAYRL
jgi:outer membrane scaffolding protein for murein synthesis (MipA/OmpV family)